jgi:hypothetical protein
MTKAAIVTLMRNLGTLDAGTEVVVGNFTIRRGKSHHRTYDIRHGSKTICGGEIPTSADPQTYPIRMAIEAVTNMEI